jgi:HPt (histidine-containing phosphotransfer) domain-containing protein
MTTYQALNLELPNIPKDSPCLDISILAGFLGENNPLEIIDFLTVFQIEATKLTADIIDAICAEQITVVFEAAHQLKSSSHTVGAMALGELCSALEVAGRAYDLATINTLLPGFEQAWIAVNSHIKRHLSVD